MKKAYEYSVWQNKPKKEILKMSLFNFQSHLYNATYMAGQPGQDYNCVVCVYMCIYHHVTGLLLIVQYIY